MRVRRICFGCFTLVVIVLGLYSRSTFPMPILLREYAGDILWAMMIYFIFAFLFVSSASKKVLLGALMFCTLIECSQLITWSWLVYLRHTPLSYILGQGFLWSDLGCYLVGCLLAFTVDCILSCCLKKRGIPPLT